MEFPSHTSAKPSHYNQESEHYDTFNEKNSILINKRLEAIFRSHNVKTILDLASGTGSQVFWLTKCGFKVMGCDINAKMLKIAKEKTRKENLDVTFVKGDMRTTKAGTFDAVITIFNAIGHLTKQDFIKAIQNIHKNLNDGGLYIFDIFNLNFLLNDMNITRLTIDWKRKIENKIIREIQYSLINEEGTLASYDLLYEQEGSHPPKLSKAFQTLQVYSAAQLKEMLEGNGFQILEQCALDGSKLIDTETERILTVARKK
jgi:2-polyprenyl-3-methyl-5-hydroxy-6-metoxy-1,4-benzoquinol methylase